MPKRSSKPKKKRPTDLNQLAASIVADATREDDDATDEERVEVVEPMSADAAHAAAVALGRLGGLKGGAARAKALTKKQRADIARVAAIARWKKSER